MYYFDADARDGFGKSGGRVCNSCCEEYAEGVPGETNAWRIGYADWLAGIRGRGLYAAEFSFIKVTDDPPPQFPSMLPPTNTNYEFQIEQNIAFSGTVATNAVSPQSSPMTFALDPVNPAHHGVVAMNSDGTFVYVPSPGFIGIDSFAYLTMDGVNAPVEHLVTFGVDAIVAVNFDTPLPPGVSFGPGSESGSEVYDTPIPPAVGILSVPFKSIRINGPFLSFALRVSPEALYNQIYRMTIAMSAFECNAQLFRHISSYDIKISSCGLP